MKRKLTDKEEQPCKKPRIVEAGSKHVFGKDLRCDTCDSTLHVTHEHFMVECKVGSALQLAWTCPVCECDNRANSADEKLPNATIQYLLKRQKKQQQPKNNDIADGLAEIASSIREKSTDSSHELQSISRNIWYVESKLGELIGVVQDSPPRLTRSSPVRV
jgi:hypothetical protein